MHSLFECQEYTLCRQLCGLSLQLSLTVATDLNDQDDEAHSCEALI